MGALEGALVTLVLIWTVIFIILGIAVVVLLIGLKKSLDRVNNILANAEEFTHSVANVGKPAKFVSFIWNLINKDKSSKKDNDHLS